MLCPHCEIDTRTGTVDGKTVLICRNPQCSFFDKVVFGGKEVQENGKEG